MQLTRQISRAIAEDIHGQHYYKYPFGFFDQEEQALNPRLINYLHFLVPAELLIHRLRLPTDYKRRIPDKIAGFAQKFD